MTCWPKMSQHEQLLTFDECHLLGLSSYMAIEITELRSPLRFGHFPALKIQIGASFRFYGNPEIEIGFLRNYRPFSPGAFVFNLQLEGNVLTLCW